MWWLTILVFILRNVEGGHAGVAWDEGSPYCWYLGRWQVWAHLIPASTLLYMSPVSAERSKAITGDIYPFVIRNAHQNIALIPLIYYKKIAILTTLKSSLLFMVCGASFVRFQQNHSLTFWVIKLPQHVHVMLATDSAVFSNQFAKNGNLINNFVLFWWIRNFDMVWAYLVRRQGMFRDREWLGMLMWSFGHIVAIFWPCLFGYHLQGTRPNKLYKDSEPPPPHTDSCSPLFNPLSHTRSPPPFPPVRPPPLYTHVTSTCPVTYHLVIA